MATNGVYYRSSADSKEEINDANEHYIGQTPKRFESYSHYCTMSDNSKKEVDHLDQSTKSRRSRAQRSQESGGHHHNQIDSEDFNDGEDAKNQNVITNLILSSDQKGFNTKPANSSNNIFGHIKTYQSQSTF